jgi:hypothetical protein
MTMQHRIIFIIDDDSRIIECVAEYLPFASPHRGRPWRLSRRQGNEPLNVGDLWLAEEDFD